MLEIRGLSAGYGVVNVLFDINLRVGAGECVGVLGPNGAGKTTLLRTISGFLQAKAGTIRLEGQTLSGLRAHDIVRSGLSQVMQGRQILGPMSVQDNLLLGGHLLFASAGKTAVARELETIYDLFPILRERARMPAGSLSGGEQQMLAIGRALMVRPRLLLLDEPSMGLAPLIVKQIGDVLLRVKRQGLTMILVEQNPDFVFGLAERCCVLESGHVVLEGATQDLQNNMQMAELYLGAAI